MFDKKGNFLEEGQNVSIPSPRQGDKHENAFKGTVVDVLETRGTVMTKDQNGRYYEIDVDRVTVED